MMGKKAASKKRKNDSLSTDQVSEEAALPAAGGGGDSCARWCQVAPRCVQRADAIARVHSRGMACVQAMT